MYDYYDYDMYPVRYAGEPSRYPAPAPPPEQGHAPIFDDYKPYPPMYQYPCPPMPEITLPAMEMTGVEYLKNLFTKLMGKKINILIEGRQKTVECVRVIKVEDGVVVVELKTGGICVIPLNEISAVCMSKELAQEYYKV